MMPCECMQEIFISDGMKKLFYLAENSSSGNSESCSWLRYSSTNEFCYDLENGWLMLALQPDSGCEYIS